MRQQWEQMENIEKKGLSESQNSIHKHFRPHEGEWVDKGIQEVSVSAIDTSDGYHVNGPADFKKVSYTEMQRGFQMLEKKVKPTVAQSDNDDYSSRLYEPNGLRSEEGRVYDAFYGDAPICLEKIGSRYKVVAGYHRLYVAKEQGIESVPASVIEKQE